MRPILQRLVAFILCITGVGQLAFSYIHVEAITKIFTNQIGFYLFLFIIFGLTTGINAVLLEKPRSLISFVFSGIVAVISGYVYLDIIQADVARQDVLTMADVSQSWQIVIASMAIYGIGTLLLPFLSWADLKIAAANV